MASWSMANPIILPAGPAVVLIGRPHRPLGRCASRVVERDVRLAPARGPTGDASGRRSTTIRPLWITWLSHPRRWFRGRVALLERSRVDRLYRSSIGGFIVKTGAGGVEMLRAMRVGSTVMEVRPRAVALLVPMLPEGRPPWSCG